MQVNQPQGGGAKSTTDPLAYWDVERRAQVPTQAFIDRLNSYTSNRIAWGAAERLESLTAQLAEAQRIAAQYMWVPVDEALPEEGSSTVAVLFDDGVPGVAWASYWHGARTDFAYWTFPLDELGEGRTVTHWMPLPKTAQGGAK